MVRDHEVAGSNPVAPTGFSKEALRRVCRRALSLTGAKFTTRNLCSTRTGRWSDVPGESTELFCCWTIRGANPVASSDAGRSFCRARIALPDEHPEHNPEPPAAAALAQQV